MHNPCAQTQGRKDHNQVYHFSCQVWMMLEGSSPVIVPALVLRLRSGERSETQPLLWISSCSPTVSKAVVLAPSGISTLM